MCLGASPVPRSLSMLHVSQRLPYQVTNSFHFYFYTYEAYIIHNEHMYTNNSSGYNFPFPMQFKHWCYITHVTHNFYILPKSKKKALASFGFGRNLQLIHATYTSLLLQYQVGSNQYRLMHLPNNKAGTLLLLGLNLED